MKRLSLLVDGRIPAHTECPFVKICPHKANFECKHDGRNHRFDFSCATAREFDLIHRDKKD